MTNHHESPRRSNDVDIATGNKTSSLSQTTNSNNNLAESSIIGTNKSEQLKSILGITNNNNEIESFEVYEKLYGDSPEWEDMKESVAIATGHKLADEWKSTPNRYAPASMKNRSRLVQPSCLYSIPEENPSDNKPMVSVSQINPNAVQLSPETIKYIRGGNDNKVKKSKKKKKTKDKKTAKEQQKKEAYEVQNEDEIDTPNKSQSTDDNNNNNNNNNNNSNNNNGGNKSNNKKKKMVQKLLTSTPSKSVTSNNKSESSGDQVHEGLSECPNSQLNDTLILTINEVEAKLTHEDENPQAEKFKITPSTTAALIDGDKTRLALYVINQRGIRMNLIKNNNTLQVENYLQFIATPRLIQIANNPDLIASTIRVALMTSIRKGSTNTALAAFTDLFSREVGINANNTNSDEQSLKDRRVALETIAYAVINHTHELMETDKRAIIEAISKLSISELETLVFDCNQLEKWKANNNINVKWEPRKMIPKENVPLAIPSNLISRAKIYPKEYVKLNYEKLVTGSENEKKIYLQTAARPYLNAAYGANRIITLHAYFCTLSVEEMIKYLTEKKELYVHLRSKFPRLEDVTYNSPNKQLGNPYSIQTPTAPQPQPTSQSSKPSQQQSGMHTPIVMHGYSSSSNNNNNNNGINNNNNNNNRRGYSNNNRANNINNTDNITTSIPRTIDFAPRTFQFEIRTAKSLNPNNHQPDMGRAACSLLNVLFKVIYSQPGNHSIRILPAGIRASSQPQLNNAQQLGATNYLDYLFGFKREYPAGQAGCRVNLVSSYPLGELKKGTIEGTHNARKPFMRFLENKNFYLNLVNDPRPYQYDQAVAFKGSDRCDEVHQVIRELSEHIMSNSQRKIAPIDFIINYQQITIPTNLRQVPCSKVYAIVVSTRKGATSTAVFQAAMSINSQTSDKLSRPATYTYNPVDIRLTNNNNASVNEWNNKFSAIHTSIRAQCKYVVGGIPMDLISAIPNFKTNDGANKLTVQQLFVSGFTLAVDNNKIALRNPILKLTRGDPNSDKYILTCTNADTAYLATQLKQVIPATLQKWFPQVINVSNIYFQSINIDPYQNGRIPIKIAPPSNSNSSMQMNPIFNQSSDLNSNAQQDNEEVEDQEQDATKNMNYHEEEPAGNGNKRPRKDQKKKKRKKRKKTKKQEKDDSSSNESLNEDTCNGTENEGAITSPGVDEEAQMEEEKLQKLRQELKEQERKAREARERAEEQHRLLEQAKQEKEQAEKAEAERLRNIASEHERSEAKEKKSKKKKKRKRERSTEHAAAIPSQVINRLQKEAEENRREIQELKELLLRNQGNNNTEHEQQHTGETTAKEVASKNERGKEEKSTDDNNAKEEDSTRRDESMEERMNRDMEAANSKQAEYVQRLEDESTPHASRYNDIYHQATEQLDDEISSINNGISPIIKNSSSKRLRYSQDEETNEPSTSVHIRFDEDNNANEFPEENWEGGDLSTPPRSNRKGDSSILDDTLVSEWENRIGIGDFDAESPKEELMGSDAMIEEEDNQNNISANEQTNDNNEGKHHDDNNNNNGKDNSSESSGSSSSDESSNSSDESGSSSSEDDEDGDNNELGTNNNGNECNEVTPGDAGNGTNQHADALSVSQRTSVECSFIGCTTKVDTGNDLCEEHTGILSTTEEEEEGEQCLAKGCPNFATYESDFCAIHNNEEAQGHTIELEQPSEEGPHEAIQCNAEGCNANAVNEDFLCEEHAVDDNGKYKVERFVLEGQPIIRRQPTSQANNPSNSNNNDRENNNEESGSSNDSSSNDSDSNKTTAIEAKHNNNSTSESDGSTSSSSSDESSKCEEHKKRRRELNKSRESPNSRADDMEISSSSSSDSENSSDNEDEITVVGVKKGTPEVEVVQTTTPAKIKTEPTDTIQSTSSKSRKISDIPNNTNEMDTSDSSSEAEEEDQVNNVSPKGDIRRFFSTTPTNSERKSKQQDKTKEKKGEKARGKASPAKTRAATRQQNKAKSTSNQIRETSDSCTSRRSKSAQRSNRQNNKKNG